VNGVVKPAQAESFEVTCPHCKKTFQAELLEGPTERLRGFKCPHCKLFTPYDRADEQDLVEPADA
jgi:hypothetical protein